MHREGMFARAPRPDLILLDLKLPKKSGREVLTEIRADDQLQKIPVVVLTGSPTHRRILQEEDLHVNEYLTKPVDNKQFVSTVKSLRKYLLSDVILPQ